MTLIVVFSWFLYESHSNFINFTEPLEFGFTPMGSLTIKPPPWWLVSLTGYHRWHICHCLMGTSNTKDMATPCWITLIHVVVHLQGTSIIQNCSNLHCPTHSDWTWLDLIGLWSTFWLSLIGLWVKMCIKSYIRIKLWEKYKG